MGIFAGAQGMFSMVHSACGKIAVRNYNRSMNANASVDRRAEGGGSGREEVDALLLPRNRFRLKSCFRKVAVM